MKYLIHFSTLNLRTITTIINDEKKELTEVSYYTIFNRVIEEVAEKVINKMFYESFLGLYTLFRFHLSRPF